MLTFVQTLPSNTGRELESRPLTKPPFNSVLFSSAASILLLGSSFSAGESISKSRRGNAPEYFKSTEIIPNGKETTKEPRVVQNRLIEMVIDVPRCLRKSNSTCAPKKFHVRSSGLFPRTASAPLVRITTAHHAACSTRECT